MSNLPESDRTKKQSLEILRANVDRLNHSSIEFAQSLLQHLDRCECLSQSQWFYVDQLASRIVKTLADYGHKTGRCNICRRKLVDPRSLTAGYGPICAAKYHLPYGDL